MKERVVIPEISLPCGCVIRGTDDIRPGETWWNSRGCWRALGCDKDHLDAEGHSKPTEPLSA